MERDHQDIEDVTKILTMLAPESDYYHTAIIEGEPTPKSRPRFTKTGKTYSDPKQVRAEADLSLELKCHIQDMIEGNILLVCIFYRSTRRTVDVDNLIKLVLDASNQCIWDDDKQVTAQYGTLHLDRDHPRTIIGIARHHTSMTR